MLSGQTPTRQWNTRRSEKARRLASVPVQGKVLPTGDLVAMLEKLIAPGDKVVLEGNNQGNDSNLLIVFYVQIMPDDFVMQLHRF
ncbi:malonate decarboxylase subunit alpha [Enterobacter hormaechei]|uniref:malonate decarboxylase subunit alpha n=1 Tax=Enterobacter hormaechei TaxID=158836 RepID=UPI00375516C8